MKNENLLNALGQVDDSFIVEAAPGGNKKRAWAKWGVAAACFCIVAAGAVAALLPGPAGPEPSVDPLPPVPGDHEKPVTSEYSSLEELLAHLSQYDYHDDRKADATGGGHISTTGFFEGAETVSLGGVAYDISPDLREVGVYQNGEKLGSVGGFAERLFILGDRLIIMSCEETGGNETDPEMSTKARIYSLSDPKEPKLVNEIVQRGELSAGYAAEGRLYLMTADGECACGWSRLSDTSGYVPALSVDGESISWGNEDITILGEPVSVRYLAVSIIDPAAGKVTDKHAFYGNIADAFYGEDWLVLNVKAETDKVIEVPTLYAFHTGEAFDYISKVALSAVFGVGNVEKRANGALADGEGAAVSSVSMSGGTLRLVGNYYKRSGGTAENSLLVMAVDLYDGDFTYEVLSLNHLSASAFDEILWEEDRVIMSLSHMRGVGTAELIVENCFVFAEFAEKGIKIYENDLVGDNVAGIDTMYWFGSPLGELEPLIPMGGGIYLRYNSRPDGLDIYDFSDSSAPKCLYKSGGELPEGCRFEFENLVYSEDTFGILMITPDEEGNYLDVTLSWRIYRVDPKAEEPFVLLEEVPVTEGVDVRAVCV